MVQKNAQDTRLQENHGLKNSHGWREGVGKPYLATDLFIRQSWAGNLESKISELAASQTLMKFNDYLKFHNWIDINGL